MKLAIIGAAAVAAAEATCATAIDDCTGNAKIDAVLKKADIGCNFGLTVENTKYTWKGFCNALKQYNKADLTNDFELGGTGECKKGLANIAGFIAQTKWESDHFKQCDETNWSKKDNPSCTQRSDGELYSSLNDKSYACTVSKTMSIPAGTTNGRDSTLECTPGTDTAGCCWWGRGPIQTTGPNNYGDLQENVIEEISDDDDLDTVDLCTDPQALCKTEKVAWLGGLHYWAKNVQTNTNFSGSLTGFAKNFTLSESLQNEVNFASGTGGVVNAGTWSTDAHKDGERVKIFNAIMKRLKDNDAATCNDD